MLYAFALLFLRQTFLWVFTALDAISLWLIRMWKYFYKRISESQKLGDVRAYFFEWFLLTTILVVFAVFISFTLKTEHKAITEREINQLKTQVKIIQSSVSSQLTSIRNAQINIRNEIVDGLVNNSDRSQFVHKRLRGFAESNSSILLMMVLDKNGIALLSSDSRLLGKNLSEFEYYLRAKHEADIDRLYISPPFENEVDSLTVATTTILPDLDGRFNGAVVTIVDSQTIVQLFETVLYAEDAKGSVAYADGELFLLTPGSREIAFEASVLAPAYTEHFDVGESLSLYETKLATDEERRLLALHTVNPPELSMDTGLLVGVSRDLQVLYSAHYIDSSLSVGLYAVLAVISALGLFVSQMRRNFFRKLSSDAKQALHEKNLELEQLNQQLQDKSEYLHSLAFIDGLTQVANRRQFDRVLSVIWLRYTRDNLPLSLLMIDLDFFKQYNDYYGHQRGDECLQAIARTLKETLPRSQDLVARYGGEEFVCLLPNTSLQEAQVVAQKLSDAVAQLAIPHASSSVCDSVTISIGIATVVPTLDTDKNSLLQAADKALYAAKQSGRNRFCCA